VLGLGVSFNVTGQGVGYGYETYRYEKVVKVRNVWKPSDELTFTYPMSCAT